jgi:hypothetical protein
MSIMQMFFTDVQKQLGVTWTNQAGFTTAFGSGNSPLAITWSGTQFVAVGTSGRCVTSP